MYETTGRIKYSEVGEDGFLMLHQLINYFQDCSTFHLEDLKINMPKPNIAFYMLSWQIEINRLPKFGESIKVGTFMHEGKGAFGYRNYVMHDEQGNVLAYANMSGCFVDINSDALYKLTPEERAKFPLEEKLEMDYLPRKIKTPTFEKEYGAVSVQQYHVDMNHHVNNSQYASIAMDYFPQDLKYKQVRIEYKKAAKYGDKIIPKTAEQDGTYYLALCDESHMPYVVFSFLV